MYVLTLLLALAAPPQRPDSLAAQVREYIAVDTSLLALTHVLLVDGTGAAPKTDQTIVIRAGRIATVGPAASVQIPAGARVMDMSGSTVIPGLIGMHDHLFYTAAGGRAVQMSYTGPRLYLGSGVTTIRTTGSRAPYAEINLKDAIDHGLAPGPRIHLTAPYITGEHGGGAMAILNSPEAARRFVAYWAAEGATWIKAYTDIRRAELGAAIQEAHRRGIKVTGHLCSVSFQEAVSLGIDNLEHGLEVDTEFFPDKKPDVCPAGPQAAISASKLDVNGEEIQSMIRALVSHHVAVTSTLPVFEQSVLSRPDEPQKVLDTLSDDARKAYQANRARLTADSPRVPMLAKEFQFERAFVKAGGLLLAGLDPTGIGGTVAGYGDQREVELLVEAGFTPVEAIKIATLNGAQFLGEADHIGSISVGKQADIMIVKGDPSVKIDDIENVELVFKDGVGWDSKKLIESVKGQVGIR